MRHRQPNRTTVMCLCADTLGDAGWTFYTCGDTRGTQQRVLQRSLWRRSTVTRQRGIMYAKLHIPRCTLVQSLMQHFVYTPCPILVLTFPPSLSWWVSSWEGISEPGPAYPRPRWDWRHEGSSLWCGWRSGTCPNSTGWKRPETGRAGGEDSCHDGQCRLLFKTCARCKRKCLNSKSTQRSFCFCL